MLNRNFVDQLINQESISKVENYFSVKFPMDFIETVRLHNHGTASPNTLRYQSFKGRSLGELLDFNLDREFNTISEYKMIKEKLLPYVFPVIGDGGGNYVCYDYRKDDTKPEVVLWDHEQKLKFEET